MGESAWCDTKQQVKLSSQNLYYIIIYIYHQQVFHKLISACSHWRFLGSVSNLGGAPNSRRLPEILRIHSFLKSVYTSASHEVVWNICPAKWSYWDISDILSIIYTYIIAYISIYPYIYMYITMKYPHENGSLNPYGPISLSHFKATARGCRFFSPPPPSRVQQAMWRRPPGTRRMLLWFDHLWAMASMANC